jgi:hypothetical protein
MMTKARSSAKASPPAALALECAFVIDHCDLLDFFHEPCRAATVWSAPAARRPLK